jgi:proline iminopeptidase
MNAPVKVAVGMSAVGLAYAFLLRPRMLRWGATEDELQVTYPRSRLIPDAKLGSTMAVTLDAPPSKVWPWLVQMGYDRAGWYSWDLLDRFGIPSSQAIHPEWQSLSAGDRLVSTPDGKYWFDVAAIEPERYLALRFLSVDGRQVASTEWKGPRPPSFADSLWEFQLKELPGPRTRLVVRVYSVSRPQLRNSLMGHLFWEPAHFVMQVRQFANLRRRVDGDARASRHASTTPLQTKPMRLVRAYRALARRGTTHSSP